MIPEPTPSVGTLPKGSVPWPSTVILTTAGPTFAAASMTAEDSSMVTGCWPTDLLHRARAGWRGLAGQGRRSCPGSGPCRRTRGPRTAAMRRRSCRRPHRPGAAPAPVRGSTARRVVRRARWDAPTVTRRSRPGRMCPRCSPGPRVPARMGPARTSGPAAVLPKGPPRPSDRRAGGRASERNAARRCAAYRPAGRRRRCSPPGASPGSPGRLVVHLGRVVVHEAGCLSWWRRTDRHPADGRMNSRLRVRG